MAREDEEQFENHPEEEGQVAVQEDESPLQEPPKYAVLLHNDNYTTMDFVIEVLERFFHKRKPEATRIMLEVHQKGKGVAGIYSLEIAETKVAQVTEYSRSNGFPLKATVEPLEQKET